MLTNSCSVFFGIGLDNNNFLCWTPRVLVLVFAIYLDFPYISNLFGEEGGCPPPTLRFIRKLESEMPATRNLWHSRWFREWWYECGRYSTSPFCLELQGCPYWFSPFPTGSSTLDIWNRIWYIIFTIYLLSPGNQPCPWRISGSCCRAAAFLIRQTHYIRQLHLCQAVSENNFHFCLKEKYWRPMMEAV